MIQSGDVIEMWWLEELCEVLVVNDFAGENGYLLVDLVSMEVLTSVHGKVEDEPYVIGKLGRFKKLYKRL